MLHTITKQLEICIDINIEITIFTSKIFRFALEITFLLKKYFFLQLAYELLRQSRKINKQVGPSKSGEG